MDILSIKDKAQSYYQHERPEMMAFVPLTAKHILEIGCGNGAFAKLIKERQNCIYWGIEPQKEFYALAQKNLDRFFNNTLDKCDDLPRNYFDCIIFNDVLEHLVDPFLTLENCKSLLIKNGYIVSSIPNMRHIPYLYRLVYKGEFEYEEAGIMDNTHLRFFTSKSIINLFNRLGFKIIKHEGINRFIPKKFSILLKILSFLRIRKFEDTSFQQFATQAQLND
jgi:2-polyprenyl-3-methyl-5-hydroxy-6-metoxy-1,4-benzoquinol methylase